MIAASPLHLSKNEMFRVIADFKEGRFPTGETKSVLASEVPELRKIVDRFISQAGVEDGTKEDLDPREGFYTKANNQVSSNGSGVAHSREDGVVGKNSASTVYFFDDAGGDQQCVDLNFAERTSTGVHRHCDVRRDGNDFSICAYEIGSDGTGILMDYPPIPEDWEF